MLKALYDYGIRNGLTLPPGFTSKPIRAYLCLSATGEYLGIEQCDKGETQVCPDIGSLANSPDKCNPLAEKAGIVLCPVPEETAEDELSEKDAKKLKKARNNRVKRQCFLDMLGDGAQAEPMLGICKQAMESEELFAAACAEAEKVKLKEMDRISFKVGGVPITESPAIRPWWMEYRKRFAKGGEDAADTEKTRCLITGELTVPLATVPMVNGLQTVGGQASGEALFCFDKSAFRSYGLKQAANAPVSEEAFAAVKAALDDLLAGSPAMYKRDKNRSFNPTAPIFAGMKFVHWYDQTVEPEEDILMPVIAGWGDEEEDDEEAGPADTAAAAKQEQAAARSTADALVQSIQTGGKKAPLKGQYHILLLSGASGRVMVRRYAHGSYEELQKNLNRWEADLALCSNVGTGLLRPRKLTARLICLLSRQKGDRKVLDRMKKELAGLTPSIVMAIVNGSPLPDAVAVRALARIRAEMLDPNENDPFGFMPNGLCCQWLKVWLLRKQRMRNEEVPLMPYYDPNYPSAAYHCGALVAIYADIQRTALKDVNAGIVQRYYVSASRAPTMVLGRLEGFAEFHLNKIENPALVRIYEERLNTAYSFFGEDGVHKLPSALNLEEQSYFALGYRQMSAQMVADRKEASARKAEQKMTQEDA